MRPLFQLELTKHTFSGGGTELRGGLSTIDTHYLSLATLCYIMEDTAVDALDNATNNYQEHACDYFHAPSGAMRTLRFRLTTYEPDLEDIYRYRPTSEGYLLLMGMLDLEEAGQAVAAAGCSASSGHAFLGERHVVPQEPRQTPPL
jgi:hypothetical protein